MSPESDTKSCAVRHDGETVNYRCSSIEMFNDVVTPSIQRPDGVFINHLPLGSGLNGRRRSVRSRSRFRRHNGQTLVSDTDRKQLREQLNHGTAYDGRRCVRPAGSFRFEFTCRDWVDRRLFLSR